MTILANICLLLAAFLALPIGIMVAEARPVSGPDTMGLFIVFVLEGLQWMALTGGVVIAARRGRFAWLHPSRVVQTIAGAVWLALMFSAAFMTVILAYGPDSATYQGWAIVLALLIPVLVTIGVAAHVNAAAVPGTPRGWRIGAVAVSLVVAAGAAAMWMDERADTRERLAAQVRVADEQAQSLAAQREQLAALGPETPLSEWLPWLDVPGRELQEQALAAVRSRPTLTADLAAMLRGPDAPEALRFLWLWMPAPPIELAAPTRDAIASLSGWADRRLAAPPPPATPRVGLDDMAQAAIVLADAFATSGLDFVTPIRAFAATLERHALPENRYAEDPTYQARSYLDTWLARQALPLW